MKKIFRNQFNKLFNNNSSIFIKEENIDNVQSNQSNEKTQIQGTLSTLISALKGIGFNDPKIASVFNKIKQGYDSTKLSTVEKNVIADVFISLIKTNNDSGLLKVFSAMKNIGGKETK